MKLPFILAVFIITTAGSSLPGDDHQEEKRPSQFA
jgi:hypothetical protein